MKIAAVLFAEDSGSRIYTQLKSEAAARVGIKYEVHEFSLADSDLREESENLPNEKIIAKIKELNVDQSVTGIIIQKPWRKTWIKARNTVSELSESQQKDEYNYWWNGLTSQISENKDVDGLHPNTIKFIQNGNFPENGKVLPATCRAVLTILARAGELEKTENKSQLSKEEKIIILGKSDLLGIPLYYELLRQGKNVELIASLELKERMSSGKKLFDATVIVSATGIKNLITGDMISSGITIIDVGEPRPDVEFNSVSSKASFITPVPGGVGPMTVISLLENCVSLVVQGEEGAPQGCT